MKLTETSESLTLDMEARTRAANALSEAIEQGFRNHWCAEWDEGDGCTICWENAADVIRAAEGLRECPHCHGTGDTGNESGSVCCDDCGGDGLEVVP